VKTSRDLAWLAVFEFVGTAIFLLGINFSGGEPGIVALSIFIAAILTGRVGGAHFNGGVTLAVYIIEAKWSKNLPIAIIIWIADLLGAYAGIGIAALLQGKTNTFILKPADDTMPLAHVFFEEMMFSTLFIAVILSTKYDRTSTSGDGVLATLTVAITLNGLVGMTGAEEGAAFNPTIGFTVPTF
jgi:glycerol uptake facilitator-like aquaporin